MHNWIGEHQGSAIGIVFAYEGSLETVLDQSHWGPGLDPWVCRRGGRGPSGWVAVVLKREKGKRFPFSKLFQLIPTTSCDRYHVMAT